MTWRLRFKHGNNETHKWMIHTGSSYEKWFDRFRPCRTEFTYYRSVPFTEDGDDAELLSKVCVNDIPVIDWLKESRLTGRVRFTITTSCHFLNSFMMSQLKLDPTWTQEFKIKFSDKGMAALWKLTFGKSEI